MIFCNQIESSCLLGDLIDAGIAELQTGPFGTMLNAKEYTQSGVPVIAVQNIDENNLNWDNLVYVSDKTAERLSKYRVFTGDIIFGRKGAVERRALIRESEHGWIQGSDCIRLRVNKDISSEFLSYQLGSPKIKQWILTNAHGTTMPSLNQEILRRLPLFLPPLPVQKKIAAILSSLDDKIEINTRMNKVLEETARALFHRWFVEFEFPNDEGKPYKSSGGRMIASEMGEIPEGWSVGSLRDLVTFSYGKPLKENERRGGPYPVFGSNGIVGWHNKWLVEGPGIIVGRKGNPGVVKWSSYNFYPIDTTFYVVPFSKDYGLHYLYSLLEKLQLSRLSADSAVPGLNRDAALKQQILIPQKHIVEKYEKIAESLNLQRKTNNEESRSLSKSRDILLDHLLKPSDL